MRDIIANLADKPIPPERPKGKPGRTSYKPMKGSTMNDNGETTQSAPKQERVAMTVIVDKSLAVWLETQAAANKRARYREVEVLLEDAKRRAESGVVA